MPFTLVLGSGFPYKVASPKKGCPFQNMVTGLARFSSVYLKGVLFQGDPTIWGSILGVPFFLGPGVGPFFTFFGLRFPYHPLKTKKGTLDITRLLGLVS